MAGGARSRKLSIRPGWLYPKSPVRFGAAARAVAFVKLVGFVVVMLCGLGLMSVVLRNALDAASSDDEGAGSTPPSTIVDGLAVALMQPVDCEAEESSSGGGDAEDEPPCNPDGILVGGDVYVVNTGVEVLDAKVTDTVFAASAPEDAEGDESIELAYIIENVDPAVLLAGSSGSSFVAITGPSIESTTTEPTLEVLFGVCVSLTDVNSYERCRVLGEPQDDEPGG